MDKDVFAKCLPYLWKLPQVSFAPAVEWLLVTLHNSMAHQDSLEKQVRFRKRDEIIVHVHMSECHVFIVALKPLLKSGLWPLSSKRVEIPVFTQNSTPHYFSLVRDLKDALGLLFILKQINFLKCSVRKSL